MTLEKRRDDNFRVLRERMVEEQLRSRGIKDERVLAAFREVPRHIFVPEDRRMYAYSDAPLSIGFGQTISQPYIVALMTELLNAEKGDKVLEIGTGSGYQAAILACLGAEVFSVERVSNLAEEARERLNSLGYHVHIKVGDGSMGWKENALYDRIIITAASPEVPPPVIEQVKEGGKIVVPVESGWGQVLTVINKKKGGRLKREEVCGCVFVPLLGKYGYKQ